MNISTRARRFTTQASVLICLQVVTPSIIKERILLSLKRRLVLHYTFVVKNWKAAKAAKSAKGMGKREELGDGAPRAKLGREADGAGMVEAWPPRRRTGLKTGLRLGAGG